MMKLTKAPFTTLRPLRSPRASNIRPQSRRHFLVTPSLVTYTKVVGNFNNSLKSPGILQPVESSQRNSYAATVKARAALTPTGPLERDDAARPPSTGMADPEVPKDREPPDIITLAARTENSLPSQRSMRQKKHKSRTNFPLAISFLLKSYRKCRYIIILISLIFYIDWSLL